jgi:hypothetical protein
MHVYVQVGKVFLGHFYTETRKRPKKNELAGRFCFCAHASYTFGENDVTCSVHFIDEKETRREKQKEKITFSRFLKDFDHRSF